MDLSSAILGTWGAVASLGWIGAHAAGIAGALGLRRLAAASPATPADWPSLSVIVAARDEAGVLESAMRSLLEQDYPGLEIVLVDDRSTDGTREAAERIASHDPRVRVVHVDALPEGWLGKVHALHCGASVAVGAWLLFTDADVHFGPGVLRRAMAVCVDQDLDHMSVAPRVHTRGFWQETVNAAFAGLFLMRTRAHTVGARGSGAYVGIGAFNLVRREALDRSPGLPWLRMEVLDDVGVGLLMREAAARSAFFLGVDGELTLEWYPSLRAMASGLEKNLFGAVARYRVGRLAGGLLAGFALAAGPALGLLGQGGSIPRFLAAAALLAVPLQAAIVRWRLGGRFGAVLLAPLGAFVLAGFLVRSAWRCLRRGGIEWRGTFYPLADLRAGQRVRL